MSGKLTYAGKFLTSTPTLKEYNERYRNPKTSMRKVARKKLSPQTMKSFAESAVRHLLGVGMLGAGAYGIAES